MQIAISETAKSLIIKKTNEITLKKELCRS